MDVTVAADVASAMTEVRDDLGPIRGIIHGAGVLADRKLEDKTGADFERVFGTKVQGLPLPPARDA